jgi:pyruvate kinase
LALYWGVVPLSMEAVRDADTMVERANAFILGSGLGSPGDKIVVVFGAPVGVSGTTNAVQVRVLG